MIEERSSGAILYRIENDKKKILLLNYPSGHWDFVKGKIEEGETLQQTVIRETKEETGISDLVFVKDFEEKIEYNFSFDTSLIHKEVVFFLAKTNTENILLSDEHIGYRWLEIESALKMVTYDNAKKILEKAKNYLL